MEPRNFLMEFGVEENYSYITLGPKKIIFVKTYIKYIEILLYSRMHFKV